jgi:hypothetical protein
MKSIGYCGIFLSEALTPAAIPNVFLLPLWKKICAKKMLSKSRIPLPTGASIFGLNG